MGVDVPRAVDGADLGDVVAFTVGRVPGVRAAGPGRAVEPALERGDALRSAARSRTSVKRVSGSGAPSTNVSGATVSTVHSHGPVTTTGRRRRPSRASTRCSPSASGTHRPRNRPRRHRRRDTPRARTTSSPLTPNEAVADALNAGGPDSIRTDGGASTVHSTRPASVVATSVVRPRLEAVQPVAHAAQRRGRLAPAPRAAVEPALQPVHLPDPAHRERRLAHRHVAGTGIDRRVRFRHAHRPDEPRRCRVHVARVVDGVGLDSRARRRPAR